MRSVPAFSSYSVAVARSRPPAASVSSSSAFARAASSVSSFASSSFLAASSVARCFSAVARCAPSRARSSEAIAASTRATSSASFAARSAAVAWSASGRRRFLTSSSRSRARSTWIATRASFSSARCRRSLKRPRPAASSTSERRSAGFAPSTVSTLPCEMIDRRPPPRPTSESSSIRSRRRTAARFTRYCPSPPRCSLRASDTSANGRSGQAPSSLSKISSTSQKSDGLAARGPGEEDVVGLLGAQLVRAQRPRRPEDRVGDVRLARAVRARRRPRHPARGAPRPGPRTT